MAGSDRSAQHSMNWALQVSRNRWDPPPPCNQISSGVLVVEPPVEMRVAYSTGPGTRVVSRVAVLKPDRRRAESTVRCFWIEGSRRPGGRFPLEVDISGESLGQSTYPAQGAKSLVSGGFPNAQRGGITGRGRRGSVAGSPPDHRPSGPGPHRTSPPGLAVGPGGSAPWPTHRSRRSAQW